MNQTAEGSGASFMEKVSAFIVDKRSLIFLITIILLIFSAFSRNWVEVESDLTYYLPEDSETKQALNVMDEQFITYGTAKIMVANITLDEAAALNDTIKSIRGVQMVDYDETEIIIKTSPPSIPSPSTIPRTTTPALRASTP